MLHKNLLVNECPIKISEMNEHTKESKDKDRPLECHLVPNCETFKETASELLAFLTLHMIFDEISNKSKLNKL